MKPDGQIPTSVEQLAFNNMVNVEALLDALIRSGVITEQAFFEAKQRIEDQIVAAQKQSGPKTATTADGPAQGTPIDPRLGRLGQGRTGK